MIDAEKQFLNKLTEGLYLLLNGWPVAPIILPDEIHGHEIRRAIELFNRFITNYDELTNSFSAIAQGNLDFQLPDNNNLAALQILGSLQSSLNHLTWKTQQIAAGDFSQHVDFMGDFSAAFNIMTHQLKTAFEKIAEQNHQLQQAFEDLSQEKEKTDRMIANMFPSRVVSDLKAHGQTTPETFNPVTVMFSDIVGFTRMSTWLEPQKLINELNELFTAFDIIIEDNGGERIKTIGDAYLAVCGMNEPNSDHARHMVEAALQIINFMKQRNRNSQLQWQVRIGVHTGKIVGGVVGIRKYLYDVFGDTINTVCRLEQLSEPMSINISEVTYKLIQDQFEFIERGRQTVKGKGKMPMYFVTGHRAQQANRQQLKLRLK